MQNTCWKSYPFEESVIWSPKSLVFPGNLGLYEKQPASKLLTDSNVSKGKILWSWGRRVMGSFSCSKTNLSPCMFFAVINKLIGYVHHHIFLGWDINEELCVWHADLQVLRTPYLGFMKMKGAPDFPPSPFKMALSGHRFLHELLVQKHMYGKKTTGTVTCEDNISASLPLKKPKTEGNLAYLHMSSI